MVALTTVYLVLMDKMVVYLAYCCTSIQDGRLRSD